MLVVGLNCELIGHLDGTFTNDIGAFLGMLDKRSSVFNCVVNIFPVVEMLSICESSFGDVLPICKIILSISSNEYEVLMIFIEKVVASNIAFEAWIIHSIFMNNTNKEIVLLILNLNRKIIIHQ